MSEMAVFMSREHVDNMNELLAESELVSQACAELERDYTIALELSDSPSGTAHLVLRFERGSGAQFSLDPPITADLTYMYDWKEAIQAGRATQSGERVVAPFKVRGDVSVTERVAKAYAVARTIATMPVEFPNV